MKTIIVTECDFDVSLDFPRFDLTNMVIKDCVGCWTCWWTTPGRCVFHDLDEFYHQYITADRVIFFFNLSNDFVSGRLKTLFDRMIPLFMPYISYNTGESMHIPRYEHYPDIEFYYKGRFTTFNAGNVFVEYIHRVFYQFHSENILVLPIDEFQADQGDTL